ncbi:MAG: class C sortase [Lactobacillales bacterium]|jgi:sortase A|nr:class C sortase [Lactobacillales bacterium]
MRYSKKKNIQFVIQWVVVLLAFVGVALITCPIWGNVLNDLKNEATMREFQKKNLSTQELAKENAKRKLAAKEVALANPYSEVGLQSIPLTNPNTNKELISHTIGEIYLPTIHARMPIFDSISDKYMEHGAAWLPTSNFPSGGLKTHTVITGHSGIPTARLFTDVPELKKGDLFILLVGDNYLAYEIYSMTEVIPSDVSKIKREEGKDLATLVTCVPIGINSKRLLVTGSRVPFVPEMMGEIETLKAKEVKKRNAIIVGMIAFVVLFLLVIFWIICMWCIKRQRKSLTFVATKLDLQQGDKFQLFSANGKTALYRENELFIVSPSETKNRVTFPNLPRNQYMVRQINEENQLPKAELTFKPKGNLRHFVFRIIQAKKIKA